MRTVRTLLGVLFIVCALACSGGGGGGGAPAPPPTADTTPPAISGLRVEPAVLQQGVEATVQLNAVDAQSGVAAVQVVLTYPDNTQANVVLSFTSGAYRGRFTAQWNGVAGVVRVQASATDGAGNRAEAETTVNAIGNPPPPPF
ncbi:MAG: hypothetical protein NZ874_10015 [Fimbriimonadales bacterium]|nr:hypothetical protein [Fimbriimonadales bacterium]